jgi:glycerate kinase
MGVATLARPRATPVALLCGALGDRAEALDAAMSLAVVQPILDRPMSLADAMADTDRLVQAGAARLARSIGIGLELAAGG